MFNPLKITPLILASTAAIMAVQSVKAQTPVTAVKINQNQNKTGLEIILETTPGNNPGTKPQVFTLSRDNQFTADIINAKLTLPNGNKFNQNNPLPGVSSITINQLDSNSIRMIITGDKTAPNVEIVPGNPQNIGFSVKTAAHNGVVGTGENPPVKTNNIDNKTPTNTPITVPNNTLAQKQPKAPNLPNPTPLVPNPDIKIEGNPAGTNNNILEPVSPAPPLLPRAIAPPVGDIAVSNIDVSTPTIDLGSNAPVKLVVKNTSTQDVLTLLARVAGLNVVFIDGGTGAAGAATAAAATNTISLDIDNEPVQNVFNYVLRMSGLEGNRSDRTIFIGKNLPEATKNIVMRTMRLNQLKVTMPETQLSTSQNSASNISSSGQGSTSTLGRTSNYQQNIPMRGALQILESMGANSKLGTGVGGDTPGPGQTQSSGSAKVLQGLQVTADARTNTITLIGPPNLVEIASAHLVQLDVRKRQVAVNIKIVEISLSNNESFGSKFSFGVGDNFVTSDNGRLNVNVGPLRPPSSATVEGNTFGRPIVGNPLTGLTRDVTTTDSFTRINPYAPFFGTDPTQPFSNKVSYSVVPDPLQGLNNNTSNAPRYYDANGVPRLYSELALPGSNGTYAPLVNPTTGLVPASTTIGPVPLFYDQNSIARPLNQLNLAGTSFITGLPADLQAQYSNPANPRPLLTSISTTQTALVPAIINPSTDGYSLNTYFGTDGKAYPLNQLTIGGGTIQPIINTITGLVPASAAQNIINTIQSTGTYSLPSYFQYPTRLLASVQAQVESGNAKILTDPTLIVQEGNQSQFSLTTGIVTKRTSTTTFPASGPAQTNTNVETGEVGVILNINVDQIDDNGFISLSVSPEVSSPGTRELENNGNLLAQLINRRRLETGNIRLRDGQTLVLTGIIQETDQTTVTKVPVLGDIPLIGSLFRSTNRKNQRQEVIVLVTPQVMDDSDRSSFGYNYTPGNETRQFLQQRGFPIQGK